MTVVRVKGFQIFKDRHGKPRCYQRKTGTPIDLQKAPLGSSEFLAECARIAELHKQVAPKPGSLDQLRAEFKASATYADYADLTKRDFERVFAYLRPIAGTLLVRFNRPLVVRIRDKAAERHGRRFGNYVKAVLSVLFTWGAERGYVAENHAAGIRDIRRKKGAPEANRPWSDQERDAVLRAAPAHMKPAIALMMFTGLGPKEALSLPRNYYRNGEIATRRAKTAEPVFWPVPRPLADILEAAPTHSATTLCANSDGLPWTESGSRASWRKLRIRLEKAGQIGPGLTLYGLRHTVAVILREIGHDERTIADALGQKTIEMARHYAKGADLRPKMRGVVKSFEDEMIRRRTKAVKPAA